MKDLSSVWNLDGLDAGFSGGVLGGLEVQQLLLRSYASQNK